MYIEIRVPIITASIFNEKTQQTESPAEIPLFSYTPNKNWTQINTFIDDTDPDNKVQVTRYYWKDIIEPGGITETIFDEVVVANITSAKGVSGKHTINAVGYGIQSEGFEDALSAWMAYKNQNGILDGDGGLVSAVTAGSVLKFINGEPKIGDTLDGEEITYVVSDIEKGEKGQLTTNPIAVTEVICDIPVVPENTTNWFDGLTEVKNMDLTGLDISKVEGTIDLFDETTSLEEIFTTPGSSIENVLPDNLEMIGEGHYGKEWVNPNKFSIEYLDPNEGECLVALNITNNTTNVKKYFLNKITINYKDKESIEVTAEKPSYLFEGLKYITPYKPSNLGANKKIWLGAADVNVYFDKLEAFPRKDILTLDDPSIVSWEFELKFYNSNDKELFTRKFLFSNINFTPNEYDPNGYAYGNSYIDWRFSKRTQGEDVRYMLTLDYRLHNKFSCLINGENFTGRSGFCACDVSDAISISKVGLYLNSSTNPQIATTRSFGFRTYETDTDRNATWDLTELMNEFETKIIDGGEVVTVKLIDSSGSEIDPSIKTNTMGDVRLAVKNNSSHLSSILQKH